MIDSARTTAAPARAGARQAGNGPAALVAAWLIVLACLATACPTAMAARGQWSLFEDHTALVRSSPVKRERTLREIQQLGADTIRIELKWNEVAPQPNSAKRPSFDATDPAAYGAGAYDDLVLRVNAMGMRVLLTLTGDAPRWATAGGRGRSFATANYRPSPTEYARFAAAMARRYSGRFSGLPAVRYFTIWNEPNHKQFLKPSSASPTIYRGLVDAAIPQIRANAVSGAQIFVGETAPVGRPGKAMGPTAFLRRWLCLNKRFRRAGCGGFKKIDADGFAHHFYGPVDRVPAKLDIINILAVRRLAKYLDRAANAGRLPRKLPIYNTEFGLQSNPPDFTVSTTPVRQAALINEKEEYSYRYRRLKSYSQYLLDDDPARPGGRSVRWSGFQTGLRFPNGKKKPAYSAYRFPIVVHRTRRGVRIWGRVRPGSGRRYLQLYAGGRRSGPQITTNSRGYFGVKRHRVARYRFKAYASAPGGGRTLLGKSRTAKPMR
jgi:cellulase (glycosyl hydrolase family 5)